MFIDLQRGYILLVVLVFLQLFTLAGLYALSLARANIKLAELSWHNDQKQDYLKAVLSTLESDILDEPKTCLIKPIPLSAHIKHDLAWWKAFACVSVGQKSPYYYVIENLGLDSCATLQPNLAAVYYRITLYAPPGNMQEGRLILQSTVVRGSANSSLCQGKIHAVSIGRQMYRAIEIYQ